jgi:hypothetical protein
MPAPTPTRSTGFFILVRFAQQIAQVEISSGQGVAAPRNGFGLGGLREMSRCMRGAQKAVLPIPMGMIFARLLMRLTRLLFCFGAATLGAGVLEPHKSWEGPCFGSRIGRNRLDG